MWETNIHEETKKTAPPQTPSNDFVPVPHSSLNLPCVRSTRVDGESENLKWLLRWLKKEF